MKIVLLGGGGHARVLIDLIRSSTSYEIEGILDTQLKVGTEISGVPVLGDDGLIQTLFEQGIESACVSVGSVGETSRRDKLFSMVRKVGFSVPPLIHSKCVIAQGVKISEGVQVMAGAILQAYSKIGENTIVNTGAIVEHDCTIGKNVHLCPGVVISGGAVISDNVFIGAGATIIQGITIGRNTIVGAGGVVVKDVPDGSKVVGVPAQ